MRWRPASELPERTGPQTALVATCGEDGEWYLVGICEWKGGRWVHEDTGGPLTHERFFWVPELELLAEIPQEAKA
ncbi:MAG: hypothetical protein IT529_06300 [Burkholderiales bacterium]|nr:hypothetical protein [Burkholderiales bacterium]